MPHDRDGELVKVGDKVNIPAIVTAIQTGEEYCNISVQPVEPMYPSDRHDTITFNSKQVVKEKENG
jgi:hypothetical protein